MKALWDSTIFATSSQSLFPDKNFFRSKMELGIFVLILYFLPQQHKEGYPTFMHLTSIFVFRLETAAAESTGS